MNVICRSAKEMAGLICAFLKSHPGADILPADDPLSRRHGYLCSELQVWWVFPRDSLSEERGYLPFFADAEGRMRLLDRVREGRLP